MFTQSFSVGLRTARGARSSARCMRAGLLLAMLLEHAVAPRIVARENLKLWHTVGSGMYLLQWACALAVLWKTARSSGPS